MVRNKTKLFYFTLTKKYPLIGIYIMMMLFNFKIIYSFRFLYFKTLHKQIQPINQPSELPDCIIINELISKANLKKDYDFNYVYQLDEVRKRVSIEVQRINTLFPEYTPHDEKYHLKRLFYVADHLLGENLIKNMNVTELFLLTISLYAHDWGMAVSENEKDHIINDCPETNKNEFASLDDEKKKFTEFCKNRNICKNQMSLENWQEYVRITHAYRSGKRIQKFFEPISSGIGEYAARICEGHWLDFDLVDNHIRYPQHAPVHLDDVNVKALTIYVRLIDLLDLGEDRTPYILWKFVAPRNNISKLEWEKHRALLPATFPKYQDGRNIQINGSTDDHNVYSSVMDLKNYIDSQFRQCSDILNRIGDSYHKLNISHINWEIAAKGFEPVLIQFEFDRNRMFEILSDQIYQGNPYVFIRELLQNAIDAIQMREEIYKKSDMFFHPKISINIEEDDEQYLIKITDNGTGMDEYIVKNYLSVAGKSYYRSQDFEKEGLNMDAISRFGIGVLSCFMVSDYIEITTHRDAYISEQHQHLRIKIPSKGNYFRIEKNVDKFDTGTSFKIVVNKIRLPQDKKTKLPINLKITEYLKKTACFVKYPIHITEFLTTTIINNLPNENNSASLRVSYDFPYEKAIFPQNITLAKDFFVEKKFDLKLDLKLDGYEGCIIYLVPKSDTIDIIPNGRSWPTKSGELFDLNIGTLQDHRIQWNEGWDTYRHRSKNDDNLYLPQNSYDIYMDGLLLPNVSSPYTAIKENDYYNDEISGLLDTFIVPYVIVNIPKRRELNIDLARTGFTGKEKWDLQIWKGFITNIKETIISDILSKTPKERLMELGKLITYYNISPKIIVEELICNSSFPLPFIINGIVDYKDANEIPYIKIISNNFSNETLKFLGSNFSTTIKYDGALTNLTSDVLLADLNRYYYNGDFLPLSITNMAHLVKEFILRLYIFDSIEFISSPIGKKIPLVKEIYRKKTNIVIDKFELNLYKSQEDTKDYQDINDLLKKEFRSLPKFVTFPKPYEYSFAYGFDYFNINNDTVEKFIQICLAVVMAKNKQTFPQEVTGKFYDIIDSFPFINYYNSDQIKISELSLRFQYLFDEAKNEQIFPNSFNSQCSLSTKDFVKNSIKIINKDTFDLDIDTTAFENANIKWGESL